MFFCFFFKSSEFPYISAQQSQKDCLIEQLHQHHGQHCKSGNDISVCLSVLQLSLLLHINKCTVENGLVFHLRQGWKTVKKTVISNISTMTVTRVLPTLKGMKIAIISGRDKFPNGQAWRPASPPVTPSL